jgi:plastocyanin
MRVAPRLLAVCASVILLSSCTGSPAPSRSTSATSPMPPTSPVSTAPSTTVSTKPSETKPGAPKPFVLRIRGFAYVPASPGVTVGQPIEIINEDSAAHTWSAAPGSGWSYTSGNLEKGQQATFPGFTKPGMYKFLCYYHAEMPSMNGIVTVMARL